MARQDQQRPSVRARTSRRPQDVSRPQPEGRPQQQARPRQTVHHVAQPSIPSKTRLQTGNGASQSARPRTYASPQPEERRLNPLARIANHWINRVTGAVASGTLSGQIAQYDAHRTSRDFIWNTVGVGIWGAVFPILTIVATQLVGTERAGMFSMAFVIATLLMIIANFGVRTYQVSDIDETHSFADYQINRWITCVAMVLIGTIYCQIRGYDSEMFYICMGVFFYRMIDGLADVYEGRLQQVDKLYLAGISQAVRSVSSMLAFSILLFFTHNLVVAGYAMAIMATITFVIITLPLALMETPRSRSFSMASVKELFKNTAPLFIALFLYALIDNMPKFVMEGALSYDNQLYFNALYFPASAILIMAQLAYKPLLVRLAETWNDPSSRRKFNLVIVGMLAMIVGITVVAVVLMAWIGIPIMSFLYGIDFEPFRGLSYIMLVAGGVTAGIDFLYQIITVMRRQRDVTVLYLVTFGFSLFVPILLVMFTGLPGAVIGYLIVMTILFVLLVWEYFRIRQSMDNNARTVLE